MARRSERPAEARQQDRGQSLDKDARKVMFEKDAYFLGRRCPFERQIAKTVRRWFAMTLRLILLAHRNGASP